ncbi:MAG: 30S ribosome-binding factor RbfA [Fusobacteriaceae bacterium]|jgi:ribosome-binding factor A|nr:30S ribosome-binding factor RbfA [Fusobacteriaceae bacterium]MBP6322267.1 30S ribosome-binding factor RbfA [Fusobacteriaceae bacterium]MBP9509571.1 30S ribosome-binding factor RbfA [Fusobacteriaceae bacterium]
MNKQRLAAIEKEMSKVISTSLFEEVKNPLFKKVLISVNNIRVTEDLKFADVYFTVSPIKGETVNIKAVEEALNQIKGFLRKRISDTLSLRFTPEIRVKMDDSINYAMKITKLLNDIKGQ